MNKPLATAPELPPGSVDFNALHDAVAKGDPDAVARAVIDTGPSAETAAHDKAPAKAAPAKSDPAKAG